ncbi:protein PALE CRESS, chloroplastic-like [Dorcoceras hygrometricum]|uniref:Protein PALE CRESS, chloroplastic-like n=1 Tax=Dorcoceras hygrometricum TaxID=472368 RepID=A0A2Z7AGX7_9LAMI|nr:protein PALE CRESS, chloroplastic-like [Dorcoceras hygrometricum]
MMAAEAIIECRSPGSLFVLHTSSVGQWQIELDSSIVFIPVVIRLNRLGMQFEEIETYLKQVERTRVHKLKKTVRKRFSERGGKLCAIIFDSQMNTRRNIYQIHDPLANVENVIHTATVAVDCEMVGGGSDGSLDLCARVSVVDEDEKLIFHTYAPMNCLISPSRITNVGVRTHDKGLHYKAETPTVARLALLPPPLPLSKSSLFPKALSSPQVHRRRFPLGSSPHRCKKIEEQDLYGLPKEYYDDEWQARQREKTKELRRRQQEEIEEEERIEDEYREIGLRLQDYPLADRQKAKKLVSSFIRSAEEVEEKIEEAAEKGELNELVLLVIWNRLDLARRDDEKDAIRSLDLLYRRVETEILKRKATPAMRLLNDLLNLHDGFDNDVWLKECKKSMSRTFPREDPFSILVPPGFDIDKHHGPMRPSFEADDILLRVDFVREVDALLQEVRSEYDEAENIQHLDPESVGGLLKQQEKQRAIRQVEALLDLAINLTW